MLYSKVREQIYEVQDYKNEAMMIGLVTMNKMGN